MPNNHPLIEAVESNKSKENKLKEVNQTLKLMERTPENLEVMNKALILASLKADKGIVKALLAKGANPTEALDRADKQFLAENQQKEGASSDLTAVVNILLQAKQKFDEEAKENKSKGGAFFTVQEEVGGQVGYRGAALRQLQKERSESFVSFIGY